MMMLCWVNIQKILRATVVSGHIDSVELKSLYFIVLFLFLNRFCFVCQRLYVIIGDFQQRWPDFFQRL